MHNGFIKTLPLLTMALTVLLVGAGIFVYKNSSGIKGVGEGEFQNVILLGWDGVQRKHLHELLDAGKLPNLEKFIAAGTMNDISITSGATDTKAGWTEILTGYSPDVTGVYSNFDYKPIAEGYTVFERLEEHFGKDDIATLFVSGKGNNVSARGPHKSCTNCLTRYRGSREKVDYWHENTSAPTSIPGEERVFEPMEGEPYYHTKNALDVYETDLGSAENVGAKVLEYIEEYKQERFFAFFHFEEPDEPGHIYGENSREYSEGIITDDYWLGQIVEKLKKTGIYDKTLIYLVSDHGFDEGKKWHLNAPEVFLATNDIAGPKRDGDREDITPTILHRYGVDINSLTPPLYGISLAQEELPDVTLVIREFLSDGPAMVADELSYYAQEGLGVRTVIVEKGEYASPFFLSGRAQFAILGNKWSLLSQLTDTEGKAEIIADLGGGGKRWRVMAGASSGISALEDLEGKRVASWHDSYGFAKFRSYLKEKHISIIPVPLPGMSPDAAVATLVSGNADALLVWEPIPSLIEESSIGYEVFRMEEIGDEMSVYLHAQADFTKEHPAETQAILRALARAGRFIRDNPLEAAHIIHSKRETLRASSSAIASALTNMDFAVRFDEEERKEIDYTVDIFRQMDLHDLPDEAFIELNGEYIGQYEYAQSL